MAVDRGGEPRLERYSSAPQSTRVALSLVAREKFRMDKVAAERAERLRAMREAATSAKTQENATESSSATLPQPFAGSEDGNTRAPGFYTEVGSQASANDARTLFEARKPPPPPPPPPPLRWLQDQRPPSQGGGCGVSRGRKAPRVGGVRHDQKPFNASVYYKVCSRASPSFDSMCGFKRLNTD